VAGGGVCAGGVSAVEVFGVEEVGAVGWGRRRGGGVWLMGREGCKCILA
jgi:hypothetical protein